MTLTRWHFVATLSFAVWLNHQALASEPNLVPDRRHGVDGSCNGSSFSSPSAQFTAADIGKVVVVSGDSLSDKRAGPGTWANSPLFSTIVGVNSATNVTLDDVCNDAMVGVTTAQWDLGTDNTIALQHCLDAGTCNVPPGSYLIAGPRNGQTTPIHPQQYPYDSDVRPP